MHYANGREAKVGDMIVTKDYRGIPFTGVVVQTLATSDTCNLSVAKAENPGTYTAKECLHVDDIGLPERKN